MKKMLFSLTLAVMVLALVLAACGSKASASLSTGSNSSTGNGASAANANQPLPLAEQLLVGIFKLEGTKNAVDAKEAAALIPLWQAYSQLTTSNTAAQAEIDSVVSQIQSTLTPQQIQAINAMKLTRGDLFTTMSSLGLTNFRSGASGTPGFEGTPQPSGGNGGFGGGGFGGGFGGGGFGGTTGGGTRPTPNATQQAARAQFANRIPASLLKALIDLLQKKAQS